MVYDENNNDFEFEDYEDIPLYEADQTESSRDNAKLTYDLVRTMMNYYDDDQFGILYERLKANDLLDQYTITQIKRETVVPTRRNPIYDRALENFDGEPLWTHLYFALLKKDKPHNIAVKRIILQRILKKYGMHIARTL